jgi:hypothetical protein
MKNEIGRKLTSLTIMAIMFAGLGIVQGVPAFMPEASADYSETDGMLSVSSVYIQVGAILEVVVNDPDFAATDTDISNGPTVDIGSTTYNLNQASNGKWYVYAVDLSQSTLLDADGDGMEYGYKCTSGIGVHKGHMVETGANAEGTRVNSGNIISSASGITVWTEAIPGNPTDATTAGQAGGCTGLNNAPGTLDDTSTTTGATSHRQLMSAAVLQGAPSLSNHNGVALNSSDIDMGQRGHGLNESGYGSWPYILAFDFDTDNVVSYGSDSINVEYGSTNDQTSISLHNQSPSDEVHLYLTITDPALNIDPTSADVWVFNMYAADSVDHQLTFASNHTDQNAGNSFISLAEMGDMGFAGNGKLGNSTDGARAIVDGGQNVTMTENASNSAVFESWATNGTSQLVTADEVGGDKRVVFTYGGDSVDMIITYNDASLSMDAGAGDWIAGATAYVTVNDPDANKYPGVSETLSISNPTAVIPTILMGSPLTLAASASSGNGYVNNNLASGSAQANGGVQIGAPGGLVGYNLTVYNTTDNSERLRIMHSSIIDNNVVNATGGAAHTTTWINVTTGHTIDDIVNLEGTAVLNYNIEGPAGDLSSTAIAVYVLSSGSNETSHTGDSLPVLTSGNARSGVVDLA